MSCLHKKIAQLSRPCSDIKEQQATWIFFAVLGINPEDPLTSEAIRAAYRIAVRHVFEGSGLAPTRGPKVPSWAQVNEAVEELDAQDIKLIGLLAFSVENNNPTWNPLASPGSREAHNPPS